MSHPEKNHFLISNFPYLNIIWRTNRYFFNFLFTFKSEFSWKCFEPDENSRINAWYWSASDDKHSLNKETLSMHSGWDKNGTIVQNLIYLYVHTSKGVVMNSPLSRNFPHWRKIKKETMNFENCMKYCHISLWNWIIIIFLKLSFLSA